MTKNFYGPDNRDKFLKGGFVVKMTKEEIQNREYFFWKVGEEMRKSLVRLMRNPAVAH